MKNSIDSNRQTEKDIDNSVQLVARLADESLTAIYVSDFETDELLYLNRTAMAILRVDEKMYCGQKCYAYLMRRDTPCPFCHKVQFVFDHYLENIIKFPYNGRQYRISSKLIMWQG